MLELEEREMSIRLECGWSGLSKDPCRNVVFDQSRLCEDRIVLSGPYGDDVAFIDQCDDEEILLGLSDGVSGTRHHGFDPYQFAHHLIQSCLEEHQRERITNSSSLRGVVHRAIRSLEKRDEIFGSATLCLMSIERSSSSLRSLNIGDSGFMLIRNQQLIRRSHPRYHRGSAPLQLATFPRTHLFTNHKTRFYQDRPSDGEYLQDDLQLGDLLLLASDGLFDNLYEDSILQIIQNHADEQFSVNSLNEVCRILVQSACHARIKRDDILVLLCCVVPGPPIKKKKTIRGERTETKKSASCSSSSDSSLSCLLLDQETEKQPEHKQEEEEEEESLDLFIFEN